MKLSIITINYNNRQGLLQTIESVIGQTWTDFEWIIIDGGSNDGSLELLESYSKHFAYWCSEADKGIYNAMNKGIQKASGEFCLFLNSGDCLAHKDVLGKAFQKELPYDIVCFDQVFEINGKRTYSSKITDNSFSAAFLFEMTFPHQATLTKRDLFYKVGFYDENLKIVADWKFFFLAVIYHNARCHYKPLIFSILQDEGISVTNIKKRKEERRKVLEEYLPPLILKDYESFYSTYEIKDSIGIFRSLYKLLAILAHKMIWRKEQWQIRHAK